MFEVGRWDGGYGKRSPDQSCPDQSRPVALRLSTSLLGLLGLLDWIGCNGTKKSLVVRNSSFLFIELGLVPWTPLEL